MKLRQKAVLSEKLKSFIQSGNYESYVLELMNQSHLFTQINTKHGCIIPINAKILFRNY